MKTIIFDSVPNTKITVVALDRLMKSAGVEKYTLTETRMQADDPYDIPVYVLGVELDDEDATLVVLKYTAADIVTELNAMTAELLRKLKSIQT